MKPCLSVVIPAINEAARLPLLLADLARGRALIADLIVVDGGSDDDTAAVARLAGASVQTAAANRGAQLRQGIASTQAPWLWLLHADARLPPDWAVRVAQVLERVDRQQGDDDGVVALYGTLRIALPGLLVRLLETTVACRSRFLQRPYGDQGLLLHRHWYEAVGGIRPLPLMEDLDLVERLARCGRLQPLALKVMVDGRRWRRLGVLRTAWINAALRRAWRQGVPAESLARRYRR